MSGVYPQLVFSAEGYTVGPDVVAHAEAKAVTLAGRKPIPGGIVRVRISRESPLIGPANFVATAVVRNGDFECVSHGTASEPRPAIDEAFRKLERALRR